MTILTNHVCLLIAFTNLHLVRNRLLSALLFWQSHRILLICMWSHSVKSICMQTQPIMFVFRTGCFQHCPHKNFDKSCSLAYCLHKSQTCSEQATFSTAPMADQPPARPSSYQWHFGIGGKGRRAECCTPTYLAPCWWVVWVCVLLVIDSPGPCYTSSLNHAKK